MRASSGIICLLLLFFTAAVFSQNRTIVFSYDNSGNRTERAIELSGGLKSLLLADTLQTSLADPGMTMILYPNPTGGMITLEIQGELEGEYYMSVTDISGVVLLHRPVNGLSTSVDLSRYPAGTYFVRMLSDNRRQYFKILKF
jgi:hypothetical protein